MRPDGRWLGEQINDRLWIGPALGGAGGLVLAEVLVRVDRWVGPDPGIGFTGDAGAARSVLGTISSATMTVLGVILTITLAVLALTANAYSPRVLRTISRDTLVKAVMASFVGTFAYSLDALRLVRQDAVPAITVSVAVALALLSLGLLIALFHHFVARIQIERVISEVHRETAEAIGRLPAAGARADLPGPPPPATAELRSEGAGRIERVDEDALVRIAVRTGCTVVVAVRPGDPVTTGDLLACTHGGTPPDAGALRRLRRAIPCAVHRTLEQDVAFGVRQLVDVALRALSPGVQDPTTAQEAIHRMGDLLLRLSGRDLGTRVHSDRDGRPLVVRPVPGWEELVGLACDQILATTERQGDLATIAVMAEALRVLAERVEDPGRVPAVRRRLTRIASAAEHAATHGSGSGHAHRAALGGAA